ncbi:MAG TPA: penicillin-binding protein [Firmicutes bacterium]|nr:penicillin-binding protein [Bacillota bacterium]
MDSQTDHGSSERWADRRRNGSDRLSQARAFLRKYRRYLPIVLPGLFVFIFFVALALFSLPTPYYPGSSQVFDQGGAFYAQLGTEIFQPVDLAEIPQSFISAVISAEDDRFYEHAGIDLRALIRALWYDVRNRSLGQGGSTITMQVAKNLYLPFDKTIVRKLTEMFYALKLERVYSKNEILEMYLNRVFFGHGTYGVGAAAHFYFGKKPAQLTLSESALLAGILPGPEIYSPYRNMEDATRRRNLILNRMVELEQITSEAADQAKKESIKLAGMKVPNRPAPYFMDYIYQEIVACFPDGETWLQQGGLKIYTTLDPQAQQAAEFALKTGYKTKQWKESGVTQPQGAIVALAPESGAIKAMVGGLNYQETQFNRITSAKRQPGSAFKPFVYGTALENGLTAATLMSIEPKSYQNGSGIYTPTDSHEFDSEMLTAREALACSSNVVAVELGYRLGPESVASFAARLGITAELEPNLSLPLGTSELTPLELAAAYAALANGGGKVQPFCVTRIETIEGKVLAEQKPKREQVLDARIAYIVTDMLRDVIKGNGTAGHLNGRPGRPAAGKTGTSQNNKDAWFVGYTPNLVGLVYLGPDRGQKGLPAGAGALAAPVWATFMEKALVGVPPVDFTKPAGLVERAICDVTSLLATAVCPNHAEYFVAGTDPTVFCRVHRELHITICRKSGLPAGASCKDTEVRIFDAEHRPTGQCRRCSAWDNFWKWLTGKSDTKSDSGSGAGGGTGGGTGGGANDRDNQSQIGDDGPTGNDQSKERQQSPLRKLFSP